MNDSLLWTLLVAQVAMAAFDTVYHHELTQKLAWRPAAARELALHATRGFLYVVVFLALGWSEPRGIWALALIAVLIAEVGITLTDFVEEDRSRRLPQSERITHTLLAINFGAILVLLVPVLAGWLRRPDGLVFVDRGAAGVFMTFAAAGALAFAARDLAAWRRQTGRALRPPAPLVAALAPRRRLLITGGTGFVGSRLVAALVDAGHDVTLLTRDPTATTRLPAPLRLVTDLRQLDDRTQLDAIVNLAGEPIADAPWTRAKRARILDSRRAVTEALLDLIDRLERKPAVLVSGSAVGWYGVRDDAPLDEAAGPADCFTHRVCEQWEAIAECARVTGVRVVLLRTGLVLDPAGGILASLLPVFALGGGGPIGHGRQWMSWIARDDLVRLIAHAIATAHLAGPLNATAPHPVRNAAFASALAATLRRPAWLHLPAALLEWALGDLARELLTGGQRVLPAKALDSGFVFARPDIETALRDLLRDEPLSLRPAAANRSLPNA